MWAETVPEVPTNEGAIRILQVIAVTLMVFPSDWILQPIGATGSVTGIIAVLGCATWVASTLLGHNRPTWTRNPVRAGITLMWIASLASYSLMHLHQQTGSVTLAADRWLLQLSGLTAIILISVDRIRTLDDVKKVLRALVWGAAFCALVGAMQFWLHTDLSRSLHLPGFHLNTTAYTDISTRGELRRVTGTAIQAIEFGVTSAMVLPLAVYLAVYDRGRRPWSRWIPVILIAAAIPISVSRSSLVAVAMAGSLFLVLLPSRHRVVGLALAPLAGVAVFMAAHGYIGTIVNSFLQGTKDSSIAHRVNNYPMVEQLVRQAPWLGRGGGTYIPTDNVHILDNQYLTSSIELGLLGLAAVSYYLALPVFVGLVARWRSTDPELRMLSAAVAGAALAGTVCSAFFDSFSFPMFLYTDAFVAGLAGSCYAIASRRAASTTNEASLARALLAEAR